MNKKTSFLYIIPCIFFNLLHTMELEDRAFKDVAQMIFLVTDEEKQQGIPLSLPLHQPIPVIQHGKVKLKTDEHKTWTETTDCRTISINIDEQHNHLDTASLLIAMANMYSSIENYTVDVSDVEHVLLSHFKKSSYTVQEKSPQSFGESAKLSLQCLHEKHECTVPFLPSEKLILFNEENRLRQLHITSSIDLAEYPAYKKEVINFIQGTFAPARIGYFNPKHNPFEHSLSLHTFMQALERIGTEQQKAIPQEKINSPKSLFAKFWDYFFSDDQREKQHNKSLYVKFFFSGLLHYLKTSSGKY